MLCKTDVDIESETGISIWSWFVQAWSSTTLFTAQSNGYYSFTVTWWETTWSEPSPYINLYKNWVQILNASSSGSVTVRAYKWDVFTYYRVNRKYTITATADYYASKWGNEASKPREIKTIWELAVLTLFWLHIDWSNYVWTESTIAVTWWITPWNFVGYVKIWNYKIPYYL